MALPDAVLKQLNANAEREGVAPPQPAHDLFKLGVLDSFALIDFVALVEEEFNIKIGDSEVNQDNFRSIDAIEKFVDARKG